MVRLLFYSLFLIFPLLLSVTSNGQVIESFTPDSVIFIKEIKEYLDTETGDRRTEIKKFLTKFEFEWNYGGIKDDERQNIYSTSNLFLEERLKPYPYFYTYLKLAFNFIANGMPESSYDSVHSSIANFMGSMGRNSLQDYMESLNNLLEEQYIYKAYGNNWKFRNGKFDFDYDSIPVFYFKNTDLVCYSQRDSIHIFNTDGIYYPLENRWKGIGGEVTWERAGFMPDEVFLKLDKYQIELKNSYYKADSVSYTNTLQFRMPLLGNMEDKVMANTTIQNASYPRFTSYNTRIQILNVFKNIQYDGGYSMHGNEVIGSGNDQGDASIYIYKDDKEFMKLSSQGFSIQKDRIFSKRASVTIYYEEDSIFHPGLQMKYIDNKKELTLIRGDEGLSVSPYFDSYHEIEMYFESLNWKITEDVMDLEKMKGFQVQSKAIFESNNYFSEYRYDRIMGIDPSHPLIVVRNYIWRNPSRSFYVEGLADYMGKPVNQVRALVIDLANQGFLTYNITEDRVVVKEKLYHYINARNKEADYDVIRFSSTVEGDKNASLDTKTFDLTIKGIPMVYLSDSQKVFLYPFNDQILVRQNRDFVFSGRVHAGLLNFYAKDCYFDYDSFHLKMPIIDSLSFMVHSHEEDENGNFPLVKVKSVIRDLNGILWIDRPDNKSSLKDYPQYPYFTSKEESYVYYSNPAIENGVYDQDQFYYKVNPFSFDSLNSFTTDGLEFDGELTSANILPDIKQPLKVQDDYSLGFEKTTPEGGYPIYDGKATYFAEIDLSNRGLKGNGTLKYLNATTESEEFTFYPDSVTARLKHFNLKELVTDVEYPEVDVDSAFMHYLPGADSLLVTNEPDKKIEMYNDSARMDGTLIVSPDGLIGDGVVYVKDAEVESDRIVFNQHIFSADTSSFRLNTVDRSQIAFSTSVYQSLVDFNGRKGEFRSTGIGSTVEFPVNQYMCFMEAFDWWMDEQKITLINNLPMEIGNLDTLDYRELIDLDLTGSEFVSLHPEQDSLKFFSLSATYDIKESVIYADDVKIIKVADAAVFPGEGDIVIRQEAKIDPILNSVIVADTLHKKHVIYNADVNILAKNNYLAKGNIDYTNEIGEVQQVYFNEISVDTNLHTYGLTNITDTVSFALSPFFDFRGLISMYADNEYLTFDGGYRVNQDCDPMPGSWVKFKSEINPDYIYLPVNDTLLDIRNKLISDALVLSLGQDIYPAFLMKKDRSSDHEIISAKGIIHYNKLEEEFRIGSLDRVAGKSNEGNYLVLSNKVCTLYGEGEIVPGMNYDMVEMRAFGNAMHYIIPDSTSLDIVLGIDFFFSDDLLEMMINDLTLANLQGVSVTGDKYLSALYGMLGKEEADRVMSDLSLYGTIRRVPKELENTLFLSDVKLTWNQRLRSFVSYGPIGIGSIKDKQINKYVNGYIVLEKRRGGDVLNIYIEISQNQWYYFNYNNLIMQAISSNDSFNNELSKLKENKRILKLDDTKQSYQYIISTRRKKIDFITKMENR